MEKTINLNKRKIHYNLRISKRTKVMRLAIYNNGTLVVTKPLGLPIFIVNYFIRSHAEKILKRLNYLKNYSTINNKTHYLKYKERARILIDKQANEIARQYSFTFNRINIRNQKTRWGSCSAKGNLNFNYKILFLPEYLRNYVITHEVCHLKEMNHSKEYWDLVKLTIPNFKDIRRKFRRIKLNNLG